MRLAYSLVDWQALAPGLHGCEGWQHWAQQGTVIDPKEAMAKPQFLPMMTARRLSGGSRAAVECGLALLARQQVDAIVFTSRILTTLADQQSMSPTDFAMSVHNSAVGSLTIAAKAPLVSTSIAAGVDSFQQGLIEVSALHQAGYQQVLLVDFDGIVPDYYLPWLPEQRVNFPYAVALLLRPGDQLHCTGRPGREERAETGLPQSLRFLQEWLAKSPTFGLPGERLTWHWERHHG